MLLTKISYNTIYRSISQCSIILERNDKYIFYGMLAKYRSILNAGNAFVSQVNTIKICL